MEGSHLFQSLHLTGFLSFAPDSAPFALSPLNVLIGPNGAGKSNLIEAFELLRAAPTDFATAIRGGGGPDAWIWKGPGDEAVARIDALICPSAMEGTLRYKLAFAESGQRVEIIDEAIEEPVPGPGDSDPFFYYRFRDGQPIVNIRTAKRGVFESRDLESESFRANQSIFSQVKESRIYPELTWTGREFQAIQTLREWGFGRSTPMRRPQPADDPADQLLPDARNLALVLNEIEHRRGGRARRGDPPVPAAVRASQHAHPGRHGAHLPP